MFIERGSQSAVMHTRSFSSKKLSNIIEGLTMRDNQHTREQRIILTFVASNIVEALGLTLVV